MRAGFPISLASALDYSPSTAMVNVPSPQPVCATHGSTTYVTFTSIVIIIQSLICSPMGGRKSHTANRQSEVQYSHSGCPTGNREKLRYSQAELGQAIKSAVAYFPSISWGATGMAVLYRII